ncbi:hypothetical protein EHI8A_160830 [Entamoeba histolytica HM-1:IMSS-B]|uniref:Uncharacterized protein n=6 Tax=Entamoeba histolytica TaxID=5759 RepID=C4MBD9_ENTH1|nr:hypothetical protein EHI_053850 [Entamoeba histolytica HM-1:IMSS]EMD45893.1 Hypothetical protein EHI5A_071810 [Entamoeba histolytica KU27]EMH72636.1 hypothetical protein EHI8A_160830 [Entamoeba histolytica HM-1:IMSS-B]EMS12545.1 hypothetical protein KM1_219620 [Entamoeba histolytica HM-3:IMSS]ENY62090.1 hypothetical protein EHI7A_131570 [Entamoeba histolytica HM-1:IMSS-A]GAT99289.1 hypothetical protein CL6EHI_053850 [Entamoeba histolytica]|eukprot:XP_654908.1 hypothetical protein EHI_053850 [Entamoeba histolytica HM-1:IMSS]
MKIIINLLFLCVAFAYVPRTLSVIELFEKVYNSQTSEYLISDWKKENSSISKFTKMDDELIYHYGKYTALLQKFISIVNSQIKEVRNKMNKDEEEYKQKKVEVKLYKEEIINAKKGNDVILVNKYEELLKSAEEEMKTAKIKKTEEMEKLKVLFPQLKISKEKLEWVESQTKVIGKNEEYILEQWKIRNQTLINEKTNFVEYLQNGSKLIKEIKEATDLLSQIENKFIERKKLNSTYIKELNFAKKSLMNEKNQRIRSLVQLYFKVIFNYLRSEKSIINSISSIDEDFITNEAEIQNEFIALKGLEELNDQSISFEKLNGVERTILSAQTLVIQTEDLLQQRRNEIKKLMMKGVESIIAQANDDLLQMERECSRNITENKLVQDKEIAVLKDLEKKNGTISAPIEPISDCENDVKIMRLFAGLGEKFFNKWCDVYHKEINTRRIYIKAKILSAEEGMEQNKRDVEVVRTYEEQRYYLGKYGKEQEMTKYWRKRLDGVDEILRELQAVEIRKLQKKIELLKEKSTKSEVIHRMVVDWLKKEFEDAKARTGVGIPIIKKYKEKIEAQVQLPILNKKKQEKAFKPVNTTQQNKPVNNTHKQKIQDNKQMNKSNQKKLNKPKTNDVAKQVSNASSAGKESSPMTPALSNGESTVKK